MQDLQTQTLDNQNSANVVRQLSALIGAGIPERQARELCQDSIDQIPERDLKQFELVWTLATTLGGPSVLALNRVAYVFDRNHRNQNEVKLAFTGPQSTAKLVMWLPVFALLLAQLTGMNPARAIVASVLGMLSVSLGLGLMVVGHYWTKRMLAQALPEDAGLDSGAFLDCVLIGLQAGLPLSNARQAAEVEYLKVFAEPPHPRNFENLDAAAELTRTTGAALSEILSANADAFREQQRFEISTRISKLGVRLMIPIGVAVLPAFILLSIVPIAISLLSQGRL